MAALMYLWNRFCWPLGRKSVTKTIRPLRPFVAEDYQTVSGSLIATPQSPEETAMGNPHAETSNNAVIQTGSSSTKCNKMTLMDRMKIKIGMIKKE